MKTLTLEQITEALAAAGRDIRSNADILTTLAEMTGGEALKLIVPPKGRWQGGSALFTEPAHIETTDGSVLKEFLGTVHSTDGTARNWPPTLEDGWEWAVLEIMGHRRHVGRIREEERFGTRMVRVDVPIVARSEVNPTHTTSSGAGLVIERWETRWYSGASIFSVALTNEIAVVRENAPYASPAQIPYVPGPAYGDDPYDDDPRNDDDPQD